MLVTVYRYGRFDGSVGKYVLVGEWMATADKIESLNADPLGDGITVHARDVVDGRWVSCSLTR